MSDPAPASDVESAPLLAGPNPGAEAEPPSLQQRVKTALHDPTHLNGLEKLLALAALFLFLVAATGFGLFAGTAVKLGNEHKRPHHPPGGGVSTTTVGWTSTVSVPGPTTTVAPPKKPGKGDSVCLTAECVSLAAEVINALDTDVNPCDDFYHFANGGWLKSNPIPDGQSQFGTFNAVTQRNKVILTSVLDAKPSPDLSPADAANLAALQNFWHSCNDQQAIEAVGAKPFLDVVDETVSAWRGGQGKHGAEGLTVQGYGGAGKPKKAPRWDPNTAVERLTNVLTYMHSRDIPALFDATAAGDVRVDPAKQVLWLAQAELGLPAKDYYNEKEVLKTYNSKLARLLRSVYAERGEELDDAEALAYEVVQFEAELARISLDPEALEDPQTTYNPRNQAELKVLFPLVSFPNYFASFTPRPDYPKTIINSPAYLENLTLVVADAEPETLEAYFVVRAAQALGPLLGTKTVVRQEVEAMSNYLTGIPEGVRKPRSDTCLSSLSSALGFSAGRFFVQEAFPGDSKKQAEEVIQAILGAFKDRLPELEWLDEATRKKAAEKADAFDVKIGYPKYPDTEDPEAIARYYSINGPVEKGDYFGNVLNARVADQRRMWVTVGQMRNKNVWLMTPQEVNAYYEPEANEIVFPAGILQPPFFSLARPEFLNFGAFGAVAGHETTHAFDQTGKQYDPQGRLEDWWTNATTARFEERRQCIVSQYSKFAVEDAEGKKHYVQANFTNGEDSADMGGLNQAWRAWQDRRKSDPEGEKYNNALLPGLGEWTREQLFFIAYAQGWARNASPEEAVRRVRTDPHSPNFYRVIGPLSNNAEFKKAFQCKAGDRMVNDKPCSLW